jgi:hypothetical protein
VKTKKRKRSKLFLQTGLTGKQWKDLRARVIMKYGACSICGAKGHAGPSKKQKPSYLVGMTCSRCTAWTSCRRHGKVSTTIRRLYLDHDHVTGRVRGVLCFRCNHRLLGRGLENVALHRSAAEYLDSTFDARTWIAKSTRE